MTEPKSRVTDLNQSYFSSAIQYYIAGRYAVFAGLIPVAGNLLHHAVEMAIKGHFSKTSPAVDLKEKYEHRLNLLWHDFKEGVANPSLELEQFNGIVSELDKFETIRYPEHVMEHGMLAKIASHPRHEPRGTSSKGSAPKYKLYLPEIDALFASIVTISVENPKSFADGFFMPDAKEFLMRDNASNIWT